MNFSFFLAKRITLQSKRTFSRLLVRIAIASIMLSMTVMLISLAVVQGFQSEIRDKITGFGSHIQITKPKLRHSFDNLPIEKGNIPEKLQYNVSGITNIQAFAYKPGILKTGEDVSGVVLKGVDKSFNVDHFSQKLTEGKFLNFYDDSVSLEVVISKETSRTYRLGVGDDFILYFIDRPPRVIRLYVSGIFETGLKDIDELFVIADIRHIRRLNNWNDNEIGGYEVLVDDFNRLDDITNEVNYYIPFEYIATPITSIYPQIFDWLGLLDMNVLIILILMLLVAGINMITALLIMIFECTRMIGILKSLGATSTAVSRIFVYNALFLVGGGMLLGNIIGLGLIYLQSEFNFISLDQSAYYVSYVPVLIHPWQVMLLNAGTFVFCLLALLIPAMAVLKISPVRAIRFD